MASEHPAAQAAVHSLKALKATPYNPRKDWSPEQADGFRRSLMEFGDLSGVVLNVRTGNLVGGNKRTEVFREDKKARVERESCKTDAQGTVARGYVIAGGFRFSYREVDWPVAKEKAANLAANKWGAEWEWEGVSRLLQEIQSGFDLSLTGFQKHELDALLAADWEPPKIEPMTETEEGGGTLAFDKAQWESVQAAVVKARDEAPQKDESECVAEACREYVR